jgi:hypothetical protein
MGDSYQLKVLTDITYLEYCNSNTGYNLVAVELTEEQEQKCQEFYDEQRSIEREFLKSLCAGCP